MASSLVVSQNNGKLRCLFLGLQNSLCARARSLRRARFPSVVPFSWGYPSQAPRGIHLFTRTSIKFGIQCTCGLALLLFGILSGRVILLSLRTLRLGAQQRRALHEGGIIEVHLSKLLLHEIPVGSSGHVLPLG